MNLGDLVGDAGGGRVDGSSVGQKVVQFGDGLCGSQRTRLNNLELQWWWGSTDSRHYVMIIVASERVMNGVKMHKGGCTSCFKAKKCTVKKRWLIPLVMFTKK